MAISFFMFRAMLSSLQFHFLPKRSKYSRYFVYFLLCKKNNEKVNTIILFVYTSFEQKLLITLLKMLTTPPQKPFLTVSFQKKGYQQGCIVNILTITHSCMSRPCYTVWSRKILEKTVNFVENNHCLTRAKFRVVCVSQKPKKHQKTNIIKHLKKNQKNDTLLKIC